MPRDTTSKNALNVASLCDGMGTCLILSFLPLYVRVSLGEPSFLMIASILALPNLVLFPVNNFWGAFVDATGRFRLVERIGLLGFTCCLFGICLVSSTLGVVAVVVGFAVLYGALRPTMISHATLLDDASRSASSIAVILLFQSMGWLISGLLYGFVFYEKHLWTSQVILAVPALLCLGMAALIPRWVRDPGGVAGALSGTTLSALKQRGIGRVLLGDLAAIYGNPRLFRVCVVVLLTSMSNWTFFGMFSLIFTEEMHGSSLMLGVTLSASTATAIIVFKPIGRILDRFGGRIGLFACIVLYVVLYAAFSLIRNPWVMSALFIVPIYPILLVSANALAAEATHAGQRAGGIGVMGGVSAFAIVLGSPLGGLVGDLFGLRPIMYVSAGLSVVSLVAFVTLVGLGGKISATEDVEA